MPGHGRRTGPGERGFCAALIAASSGYVRTAIAGASERRRDQSPIDERSIRERDQLELIDHLIKRDRRVTDALLAIAEHISSSGDRSLAPALCTVLAFALRSVLRTEGMSE